MHNNSNRIAPRREPVSDDDYRAIAWALGHGLWDGADAVEIADALSLPLGRTRAALAAVRRDWLGFEVVALAQSYAVVYGHTDYRELIADALRLWGDVHDAVKAQATRKAVAALERTRHLMADDPWPDWPDEDEDDDEGEDEDDEDGGGLELVA